MPYIDEERKTKLDSDERVALRGAKALFLLAHPQTMPEPKGTRDSLWEDTSELGKRAWREQAAAVLDAVSGPPESDERDAQTAGELTYQLQQALLKYIEANGLKYQILAECLGALEGAKIDLTERVIKPYEMRKARENGDVWPNHLTNAGYTTPAAVSDNDVPRIRQAADPFPCSPQEA